jgi:hypothetical protein
MAGKVARGAVVALLSVGAMVGLAAPAMAGTNDGRVGIQTNVRNELHTISSAVSRIKVLCPLNNQQANDAVLYADRTGYTMYPCYNSREGRVRIIGGA